MCMPGVSVSYGSGSSMSHRIPRRPLPAPIMDNQRLKRVQQPKQFYSPQLTRHKNNANLPPEESYDDSHIRNRAPSPGLLDKIRLSRPMNMNSRLDDNACMNYEGSDFVLECLKYHNLYRHRHQAPPLRLSNQLCSSAQNWANHLAHTNSFFHQSDKHIGQNLFFRWASAYEFDVTGREVSDYWYTEVKNYDFNIEPEILHVNAGHFTQLVWVGSRDFGVGKARTRHGKIIVVASYSPTGNIPGHFPSNVKLPARVNRHLAAVVRNCSVGD